jgi:hypothetical protein
MASERVVSSVLTAIVITAMLFVLYATFGIGMNDMNTAFNTSATNLTMVAGWHTIARNVLSTDSWWKGWGTFWLAGIVMCVCSWVWVGKTIIIDSINDKPGGF